MSLSFLNSNKIMVVVGRLFILTAFLLSINLDAQVTPFNVNKPDKTITMDDQLVEISGIIMMPQDSVILTEQDEAGIIYTLDKNTGKILRQVMIEQTGDFEDIAFVHPYIYLLKSKGSLYRIKYNDPSDITIYKTKFSKGQDTEGMGYDPVRKQLLIACKANKNPPFMYERDVFTFDIKSGTFSDKPLFIISRKSIIDFLAAHPSIPDYEKLNSSYNENNQEFPLGPSGIAVDPITNNIFVISSIGKVMVVFDHNTFAIKDIIKLQKNIFTQPEGISFDSKGNLYISNEGKDSKGSIVFCKRGK